MTENRTGILKDTKELMANRSDRRRGFGIEEQGGGTTVLSQVSLAGPRSLNSPDEPLVEVAQAEESHIIRRLS